MDKFLKFLHKAKTALTDFTSYEQIHLVLGNESCDLDSTISALSLAFLIHCQKCPQSKNFLVIPIMNVEAKYFPLRTETCYLLNKYGIDWNTLVFRDQIKYSDVLKINNVSTSLVDHHVLAKHDKILEDTVIQIFDHRPLNTEEVCQSKKLEIRNIEIVGSCTTLITRKITASEEIFFEELRQLLYATIIYDTIGLNKECGKTFDDDVAMAEHLEKDMKTPQDRKQLFELLWKIHNDTSSLTTKDLLYRDLKVVKGVPIPGVPMLVEEYLKRQDVDVALESFAKENNSSTVVIIGIDASEDVKRDIAIFSSNLEFRNTLSDVLKKSQKGALELTEITVKNRNVVCLKQGNIKLSRKFILPLVNEAASQFENDL